VNAWSFLWPVRECNFYGNSSGFDEIMNFNMVLNGLLPNWLDTILQLSKVLVECL
jgi:hypothetical protein